jgi:glucose/arabinose dehydrogenase
MEYFIQRFSMAVYTVGIFIVILIVGNVASANAKSDEIVDGSIKLSPLIADLPSSWALEVSPDNFLYVSHRHGELAKYSLSGEKVANYDLSLTDLYHKGQGGLSAIAFHPSFDKVPWIYLSYSFGNDNANGLKVIRVLLQSSPEQGAKVLQQETIYEQSDLRDTAVHYGARLAFMADNSLLITTGDGFDYRESAQKLNSDMGKVLRVTDTGEVPDNNPYANAESTVQQYVYSRGHRNPQALIVLANNQIIAHEHGPAGGDEINIIEAGKNYGWPVITNGKDYIGSLITPFTEYEGMEQPDYDWTPSMAPSGVAFYQHSNILPFANKLLVSSLKFQQLHTLSINNQQIENEVVYFANSGYRMKDLAVSNEGRVFILSDGGSATIFEVLMNK